MSNFYRFIGIALIVSILLFAKITGLASDIFFQNISFSEVHYKKINNYEELQYEKVNSYANLTEDELNELIINLDSNSTNTTSNHIEDILGILELIETNYPNNNKLKSLIYHVAGKIYIENSEIDKGLELLKKCIIVKIDYFGETHVNLAKTYNYIGIAYQKSDNYDDALEHYKLALAILESNNIQDINLFDASMNIGIIYAIMSKYNSAYEFFGKANELLSVSTIEIHPKDIASFYVNYGAFTSKLGKLHESNTYYDRADSLLKSTKEEWLYKRARIYLNKGINYYYDLDYSNALLNYNKAISLFLVSNYTGSDIARCYNNLSAVSLKTYKYEKSKDFCLKGLQNNPGIFLRIKLTQNLAKSYMYLENNDLALLYYKEIVELLKGSPPSMNNFRLQTYLSYAYFLYSNDDKSCYSFYTKALELSKEFNTNNTRNQAYILSRLGWYFLNIESNITLSKYYFESSLNLWQNHFENTMINNMSISNDISFIEAFSGYSEVLHRLFTSTDSIEYLIKSEEALNSVLGKIEIISKNISNDNLLLINSRVENIYDDAINLTYKLYELTNSGEFIEKGFLYAEKSKSTILLNSIKSKGALKVSGIPYDVIKFEEDLNTSIEATRKLIFDENQKQRPVQANISFYESRIIDLNKSKDSLISQLEDQFPDYYALKYNREVMTIDKLQESISNTDILVEYEIFRNELFIFLVGKESKDFYKIELDEAFYGAIDTLLFVRSYDESNHDTLEYKSFINNSNILYEKLLGSTKDIIKDKKLIIIPDGLLGYLPFDILVSRKTTSNRIDYANLDYLIKNHPISYNYSTTLRYSLNNEVNNSYSSDFLGFAPEYFRNSNISSDSNFEELANLMFSNDEIKKIKREIGGKIYKGKNASKSKFLELSSVYDIIHLSQHALLNDTLPMYSRLVFSNNNQDIDESSLYTYEIYDLKLKAKMVTLSACSTGSGKLNNGEGIMSLARGFIYAGVPSITMTLWEAEDRNSSEIMISFYKYLKEGYDKDIALQKSKLDYLKVSNQMLSYPFFWAPYIVTGSTESISISPLENNYLIWVIVSGVIGAFIFLFILRRRCC